MDNFFRGISLVLIAVILILVLQGKAKEMAMLLSLLAVCLCLSMAFGFLAPVLRFLSRLQMISGLDPDYLGALLKIVAIGLTGEMASLICSDAGSSALGKTVQLLSSFCILWLSLPMLTALLDLVEDILEKL